MSAIRNGEAGLDWFFHLVSHALRYATRNARGLRPCRPCVLLQPSWAHQNGTIGGTAIGLVGCQKRSIKP
jgi:hypothetical protein